MGQNQSLHLRLRIWRRRIRMVRNGAIVVIGLLGVRVVIIAASSRGGGSKMQNTAHTAVGSPTPTTSPSSGLPAPGQVVSKLLGGLPVPELAVFAGGLFVLILLVITVVVPSLVSAPGFASAWQIRRYMSPRAARRLAAQTRPSIDPKDAHWSEYSYRVGTATRPRAKVASSLEDNVLIMGPSRAYKSVWLAGVILDWVGAVIHTTTKIQDVEATIDVRRNRGPIFLFNPYNLGRKGSNFVWDLVAGCEDPAVALRRTGYLLYGGRRQGDSRSLEDFFTSTAADVLRAYLHAAALAGLSMREVYAWACNAADTTAQSILRQYQADQMWLETLQARQSVTERTRDGIYTTLSTTLSWMADPAVARSVCPEIGEENHFNVANFLAERGTLYLVAELRESDTIAPLMTAFMGHVVESAKLIASMSPTRRLDPPLLIAGDEIGNICPIPLPSYMSELPGLGILTIAAIQSRSQLVTRWSATGASTIWNNSAWTLVLAGIKDTDDLKTISDLCGEREHRRTVTNHGPQGISKSESVTDVPVMTVSAVRQLKARRILAIYRGQPPVIVRVPKTWRRKDVRQAKAQASNRALKKGK